MEILIAQLFRVHDISLKIQEEEEEEEDDVERKFYVKSVCNIT